MHAQAVSSSRWEHVSDRAVDYQFASSRQKDGRLAIAVAIALAAIAITFASGGIALPAVALGVITLKSLLIGTLFAGACGSAVAGVHQLEVHSDDEQSVNGIEARCHCRLFPDATYARMKGYLRSIDHDTDYHYFTQKLFPQYEDAILGAALLYDEGNKGGLNLLKQVALAKNKLLDVRLSAHMMAEAGDITREVESIILQWGCEGVVT